MISANGDHTGSFIGGPMFECKACITHGQGEPGLSSDIITGYPPAAVANFTYALLLAGNQGIPRTANAEAGRFKMAEHDDEEFFGEWSSLDPITNITPEFEVRAADIAARHPVLALIGAQNSLPRIPLEEGASEQAVIITTLQVKWDRAIGVLSAVLGLQFLAIVITAIVTRRVPVLDHQSYFAVARLMRTAMNSIETGPIARQAQLTESIGYRSSSIRYGTRQVTGENADIYQLDVWNDVENVFPKRAKYI